MKTLTETYLNTSGHTDARSLISSIVYLASLASDVSRIDPWLDSLRAITARQDFTAQSPLGLNDEQTLLTLRSRLKDYLVSDDPLRRFDPGVLDQKIYENLEGRNRYRKLRFTVAAIVAAAVITGGIAGTLGRILHAPGIMSTTLPFLAGFGTLYIGALYLLAQAARTFNRQLRQVYVLICGAIFLVALTTIQFAFSPILKDTWWMKTWAFSLFFIIIGCLLYVALRKFALQMEIKSALTSLTTMGVVAAATVVGGVLIPHAQTSLSEPIYDLSVIGLALLVVLLSGSIWLGWAIVRKVSPLYTKAIWCLMTAMSAMVVGGSTFLIIRLVWLETREAPLLMVISAMLFFMLSGFTYLYASYVFNKMSRY